jgi:hypothetical protein
MRIAPFLALVLLLAGCGPAPQAPAAAPASGWHEFEGTWNAAGTRRTLALGDGRRVALLDLQGTMLLAGAGRPGVGFRAEAFALSDTATGLVGRSVWTDEGGNRVFSELKGEGTVAKNRITGSILGGTGRFAGITGDYEFSWQYVVESEDGSIQGRATGLKGRFRVGATAGAGAK